MTLDKMSLGEFSHINNGCFIDAMSSVTIGNSVSKSFNTAIVSGGHKVNSSTFECEHLPIIIGDYAWIGVNATILKAVTIG